MKSEENKTLTCIVCPIGCKITVRYKNEQIKKIEGNKCPKGEKYARQEFTDPRRSIASSILVIGGELPLCSVRTNGNVPKAKIAEVMKAIRRVKVNAPIHIGDIILKDVAETGVDIISTKTVSRKSEIR